MSCFPNNVRKYVNEMGKCKAKLLKFKHFQMASEIQRFTRKLAWELPTRLFVKHAALQCKYEHAILATSVFGAKEHFQLFFIKLDTKKEKSIGAH